MPECLLATLRTGAKAPFVAAIRLEGVHVQRLHRGGDTELREPGQILVGQDFDVLDPVMNALGRTRPLVRIERTADSHVATGVSRALEAGLGEDPHRLLVLAGSGQNGSVPIPFVSGSISQPVPDSITPSMKNLATPPRQSSPRTSRQEELIPHLLEAELGVLPERDGHPDAQVAPGFHLTQQVERLRRAVHGMDTDQADRIPFAHCLEVPAGTCPQRSGFGITRRTSAIAPPSRNSPVGTPSSSTTTIEKSGKVSRPVTSANAMAAGETTAVWPSKKPR